MADKIKETNEYNQLKSKYVGLGNPDTSRAEFMTNVHRDTLASLSHHSNVLLYNSVVLNEHPELVRQELIKKMVQPIKKAKE
ncbi:splicing factor 3B subunit 5/RDS3 complex subunit 10 [Scheffersomyces xylosifermentans]|uniref:splicing factor 3B subunit 5/RDS3 complex subunit 10 n=1 Tax=Scheffersomyces xylosifermentans TaxID=1304137 RepID=UPI00315DE0C7